MIVVFAVAAAVVGGWSLLNQSRGPIDEGIDASGVCRANPNTIARLHGVSLDVEALGRVLMSEATNLQSSWAAVGSVVINRARKMKLSVGAMLLRVRKGGAADGKFGSEKAGKVDGSTARPSTPESRAFAADLLAGKIGDPTKGATMWDSPAAQDALAARPGSGYTKTAAQVAADRSKTADLVTVPGVSKFRFWRPRA